MIIICFLYFITLILYRTYFQKHKIPFDLWLFFHYNLSVMENMEKNLTQGSIFKNIVVFSLPFLLSYFLQTLYGMADLFIAGQFNGANVISAVSIGSQVMHMFTVMIVGLAMGGTVLIGQAVGARDSKKVSNVIGNTIPLFIIIAIFIPLFYLFCVEKLFWLYKLL